MGVALNRVTSPRSAVVLAAIEEANAQFVSLRRDLHQHPELAFAEFRTADKVATLLREWGYQVSTGIGGTGVVGTLRRGQGDKSLGLRADMDALPIQEATGLPYASQNAGVMHACGHDGHTAILLAAARFLALHGQFDGTLQLIFQPAEETGSGAGGDRSGSSRRRRSWPQAASMARPLVLRTVALTPQSRRTVTNWRITSG